MKVQALETPLLQAIDQIDRIVIHTNIKGEILYVNNAFCNYYEYSEYEVLGKNVNIIRSDYHSEDFYIKMWEKLLNEEPWEGSFLNQTKSGRLIWQKGKISPVYEQDNITGFLAIMDIIKQSDIDISSINNLVLSSKDLFEMAPFSMVIFKLVENEKDIDYQVIKANIGSFGLFERDKLLGISIFDLFGKSIIKDNIDLDLVLEKPLSAEFILKNTLKTIKINTLPIDDNCFCIYSFDNSEYNQIKKEFEKINVLYGNLITSIPIYLRMFDKNGQLYYVNPLFAKKMNMPQNQLSHTPLVELPGYDKVSKMFNSENLLSYIKENGYKTSIINIKDNNKQGKWEKWSVRPITETDGSIDGYLCFGIDITKQKDVENNLNNLKNNLLSQINNITTTSLNNIIKFTSMLKNNFEDFNSDDIKEIINMVDKDALNSMNTLKKIEQFLKNNH